MLLRGEMAGSSQPCHWSSLPPCALNRLRSGSVELMVPAVVLSAKDTSGSKLKGREANAGSSKTMKVKNWLPKKDWMVGEPAMGSGPVIHADQPPEAASAPAS